MPTAPMRLATFRQATPITRVALAKQLGCSRSYLWSLERGARLPGRRLALAIESLTGIEVSAWDETPA